MLHPLKLFIVVFKQVCIIAIRIQLLTYVRLVLRDILHDIDAVKIILFHNNSAAFSREIFKRFFVLGSFKLRELNNLSPLYVTSFLCFWRYHNFYETAKIEIKAQTLAVYSQVF
jgi:hypothetical protein